VIIKKTIARDMLWKWKMPKGGRMYLKITACPF
jgi:hypothetical protein